jgi:hypothetical protein
MFANEFQGILFLDGVTQQLLLQYVDDTTFLLKSIKRNLHNLVHRSPYIVWIDY